MLSPVDGDVLGQTSSCRYDKIQLKVMRCILVLINRPHGPASLNARSILQPPMSDHLNSHQNTLVVHGMRRVHFEKLDFAACRNSSRVTDEVY